MQTINENTFPLHTTDDGVNTGQNWLVMKFGGTSVSSSERWATIRELVIESGLLDYWRQWGWSDYCEEDGDSFRCD